MSRLPEITCGTSVRPRSKAGRSAPSRSLTSLTISKCRPSALGSSSARNARTTPLARSRRTRSATVLAESRTALPRSWYVERASSWSSRSRDRSMASMAPVWHFLTHSSILSRNHRRLWHQTLEVRTNLAVIRGSVGWRGDRVAPVPAHARRAVRRPGPASARSPAVGAADRAAADVRAVRGGAAPGRGCGRRRAGRRRGGGRSADGRRDGQRPRERRRPGTDSSRRPAVRGAGCGARGSERLGTRVSARGDRGRSLGGTAGAGDLAAEAAGPRRPPCTRTGRARRARDADGWTGGRPHRGRITAGGAPGGGDGGRCPW